MMRDVRKIGRRTWLTRSATGLLAVWAGLDLGFGRQGWGVRLGNGRAGPAAAQESRQALRVNMGFVSAYVMVRGGEIAIVDTGTPNNGTNIGEVIRTTGLGWDAVRHVILTHYHSDHAGSIGEVLGMASQAAVYAGAPDIPRISAPRDITPIAEGDEIFGLQIIATPGHTAGHVSVYDPAGTTLVTGDAVVNIGDQLAVSPPQFTADMNQAA